MNKWSNYGKWRHPEKRKELMKIDNEDFNRKAQHIIDTVVNPQAERYEQAKKQEETITKEKNMNNKDKQKLVKKWESSGLLDNIKGESSKIDIVNLLQSNATQLLDDWDVTLNDGLENEPYISDDFQIGPDGAYEHIEENKTMTPKEKAKDELIKVLYSQVVDLTMMSKIELGDDVITEIKRLKDIINEK